VADRRRLRRLATSAATRTAGSGCRRGLGASASLRSGAGGRDPGLLDLIRDEPGALVVQGRECSWAWRSLAGWTPACLQLSLLALRGGDGGDGLLLSDAGSVGGGCLDGTACRAAASALDLAMVARWRLRSRLSSWLFW